MALVYDKYFKTIPSSYKITGAVPIDLRQVVLDLSNLYGPISEADHTWEDGKGNLVTYTGMLVTVRATQEVYMCINESLPYIATSWKRVGGANATITAVTIDEYPGYITEDNINIAVEEINGKYYRVDKDDPREEIDPSDITFETVYAESEHTEGSDEKGIVINNQSVHDAGTYIKVEDEDGTISYSKINIDALVRQVQELQVQLVDVSTRLNNTIEDLEDFKEYVDASLVNLKEYVDEQDSSIVSYINNQSDILKDYIDSSIENLKEYVDTQDALLKSYVDDQDASIVHYTDEKLEEVSTRIDAVDQRIADVSAELTELTEVVEAIGENVDELNVDVSVLKSDVAENKEEIAQLHVDVSTLDTKIDTVEETINDRIDSVEEHIDASVNDLQEQIDDLSNNVVNSVTSESEFVYATPNKGDVILSADIIKATDETTFQSTGLVTNGYVDEKMAWIEIEEGTTVNPSDIPASGSIENIGGPVSVTLPDNVGQVTSGAVQVSSTAGDVTINGGLD